MMSCRCVFLVDVWPRRASRVWHQLVGISLPCHVCEMRAADWPIAQSVKDRHMPQPIMQPSSKRPAESKKDIRIKRGKLNFERPAQSYPSSESEEVSHLLSTLLFQCIGQRNAALACATFYLNVRTTYIAS
jgi:hypothetical protein